MTSFTIFASIIGALVGGAYAHQVKTAKKRKIQQLIDEKLRSAENFEAKLKADHQDLVEINQEKLSQLVEDEKLIQDSFAQRIELKEASLKKREDKNAERIARLQERDSEIGALKLKYAQMREELGKTLTQKAGLSVDSAKEKLFDQLSQEFESYFEKQSVKLVENTKEIANKQSTHLLKSIMQKYAEPSSVDHLDKLIKIPKDSHKGKLLGKGGENIIYLEELTGVDIIFENEPGYITVTCFNLVHQEVAKRTILKLFHKHEINKSDIDTALATARAELNSELLAIGTEAAKIIGIKQQDPELLTLIGRLKYRTSYGQNILYHSYEIAYFSALMASEIGADIETAKIGGFLHDIGKAIDQEVEGSHDYLGKEIMEKYGFTWEEVHAAWTHHDAIPIETVEAQIVKAADAISAGRPGARTESAQMYVERIQGLERLALETQGVKKAYALSAGREIRTVVDEQKLKDEDLQPIAEDLAKRIQDNLTYPGKIKVNLIRTVENVSIAKSNKS